MEEDTKRRISRSRSRSTERMAEKEVRKARQEAEKMRAENEALKDQIKQLMEIQLRNEKKFEEAEKEAKKEKIKLEGRLDKLLNEIKLLRLEKSDKPKKKKAKMAEEKTEENIIDDEMMVETSQTTETNTEIQQDQPEVTFSVVTATDDGFTTITKRKKASREASKVNENMNNMEVPREHEERIERTPPPVFIHKNSENKWPILKREIDRRQIILKPAVYNKFRGMKLQAKSKEDYRRLTAYLEERQDVQWYTFQPREDRQKKIVIKGLLESYSVEEVKEALEAEHKLHPIKVAQLRSRYGEKRLLPYFMVEIVEAEEVEYRSIRDLLGLRVTTENAKKQSGVLQCYRCQGFHHGQSTCHMEKACVRCAGNHEGECPRAPNSTPTCANCGGQHPANYRGCPKTPKPSQSRTSGTYVLAPKEPTAPKKTYAQATNNSQQIPPNMQELFMQFATWFQQQQQQKK